MANASNANTNIERMTKLLKRVVIAMLDGQSIELTAGEPSLLAQNRGIHHLASRLK